MSRPAPYAGRIHPEDGQVSTARIAGDSDRNRFLKTLRREPTDRLPTHEYLVGRRSVEAILNRPADASWGLSAGDFAEFATRIGQDSIGGPVFVDPPRYIHDDIHRGDLMNRDDLRRLRDSGVLRQQVINHAKIEAFLKAAEKANLGVWNHVSGGLTMVYEAMGIEDFALCVYDDPAFIAELLNIVADTNTWILQELSKYPFSFFHLGDDLGHKGGLLVSPDFLREHWLPCMKRTIAPAKDRNIPVTFHSDGQLLAAIPQIIEAGFVSLNPIEPYGMSIYDVKARFGDKLTLIGNIDVAGPLAFGTFEQIDAEVREHVTRLAPTGGYVGATSHSVIDDIPPRNFVHMLEQFRIAP